MRVLRVLQQQFLAAWATVVFVVSFRFCGLYQRPQLGRFDNSCFNGSYVTGGVSNAYLMELEQARSDDAKNARNGSTTQGQTLELFQAS